MRKIFPLSFALALLWVSCFSQEEQEMQSRNGWILSPHGTIRLLVVLVDVEYDVGKDPFPSEGYPNWKAGQLPAWKDEVVDFSADATDSKGILTQYFKESSFGDYIVIGDRVVDPEHPEKPITIKASGGVSPGAALKKINSFKSFATAKGLQQNDFDLWTMSSDGRPKITPSKDSLMRYDHIMFIFRNSKLGDYSGYSSSGSPGELWGFHADSHSQFNASNGLPFRIMLHEYSHQLYGGNNFHVGGGQHGSGGANYFIPFQGGWSNMGAANSSLLTCNGWDRDRMDWKGPGKAMNISAIDSNNRQEMLGDLDAKNLSQAGKYILRDFATTGDALRIKLPFLSDKEYPQWIWIENHQPAQNKSRFDKFHHQGAACIDVAPGGLYMYLQVDRNEKTGANIYGGFGDYLRPMPAGGMFDMVFDTVKMQNRCINDAFYEPFEKKKEMQNPLTGNHDLEMPPRDFNKNCSIEKTEQYLTFIEKKGEQYSLNLPFLGTASNAFTMQSNHKIGMGTNPCTANMITLVSDQPSPRMNKGFPNNRKIYLNGISVNMLEQRDNGDVLVEVKFNDVDIEGTVRWCADSIVLSKVPGAAHSLNLKTGSTLLLDRGKTPTRITDPEVVNDESLFTHATVMTCLPGSEINMEEGSTIIIDHASTLELKKGSRLIVNKNCKVIIRNYSLLLAEDSKSIIVKKGGKLIKENGGKVLR